MEGSSIEGEVQSRKEQEKEPRQGRFSLYASPLQELLIHEGRSPEEAEAEAMNIVHAAAKTACSDDETKLGPDGFPMAVADFVKMEEVLRTVFSEKFSEAKKRVKTQTAEIPVPEFRKGSLEDVFSREDPEIGSLVAKLETTVATYGLTTADLVQENNKLTNRVEREEIIATCLDIAKEMVRDIGGEQYDIIRGILIRWYYREVSSKTLFEIDSHQLANQLMEQHGEKSWRSLPRVWVAELMFLKKHPEIVAELQTRKAGPISLYRFVEEWYGRKARERLPVVTPSQPEEYIQRNVDVPPQHIEEFIQRIRKSGVLEGAKMKNFCSMSWEQRNTRLGTNRLNKFYRSFFSGLETDQIQFLKILIPFIQKTIAVDMTYQAGDERVIVPKSNSVSTPEATKAAVIALEKIQRPPTFIPIVKKEGIYTLRIEPLTKEGKVVPTLKIIDTSSICVICNQVEEDAVEGVIIHNPGVGDYRSTIRDGFDKANAELENPPEFDLKTMQQDERFHAYALVRYMTIIISKVYMEKKNEYVRERTT